MSGDEFRPSEDCWNGHYQGKRKGRRLTRSDYCFKFLKFDPFAVDRHAVGIVTSPELAFPA
jgi:hypothetical protein